MKDRNGFLDAPVALGTFLSLGSPVVAEVAAEFPFNWFLLDMEHGSGSEEQVFEAIRAMAASSAHVIVRVPGLLPDVIGRVLDRGADGIMLPHVSNAKQAEACVQAMRYVPRGTRGFSSSVRAYGYGLRVPSDLNQVNPIFIAQIEDVAGVKSAHEIAAVDGVDVLFVGPADLRLTLNQQVGDQQLSYEDSLAIVAEAARAHGKKAGILMRDMGDFDHLKNRGYRCIAVDSDLAILRRGYQEILKRLKE